jgi:hypothetical protein
MVGTVSILLHDSLARWVLTNPIIRCYSISDITINVVFNSFCSNIESKEEEKVSELKRGQCPQSR